MISTIWKFRQRTTVGLAVVRQAKGRFLGGESRVSFEPSMKLKIEESPHNGDKIFKPHTLENITWKDCITIRLLTKKRKFLRPRKRSLVEAERAGSGEDFSNKPINRDLRGRQSSLYEQMVRIRRFEERSLRAYQQGHIGGFLHLYIGQEAVAVGSVSAMGDDDHVITAYRDHGHALAVGMNMDECMAELYGKKTGCSKGKGGSMHFFAPDKNFWGGHGSSAVKPLWV